MPFKNKTYEKQYKADYYQKNKERILKKQEIWRADNGQLRRLTKKREHRRLKIQTLSQYSNGEMKCACCDEKEILFLTLDHVNNDGNMQRKELGGLGGHRFYEWLKKNKFPAGFQVLCFNCNYGKFANGGNCPHVNCMQNIEINGSQIINSHKI